MSLTLPPTFDWLQSVVEGVGVSTYDSVDSVTTDTAGNVYICGQTDSQSIIIGGNEYYHPANALLYYCYIAKLNSLGAIIWLRWISGLGSIPTPSITPNKITTGLANVYIVGQTDVPTIYVYDGLITPPLALPVVPTTQIVAYANLSGTTSAGFLFSIDTSGAPQWFRFFDSSISVEDMVSVTVDPTNNNVCVCSRGTGTTTAAPLIIDDGTFISPIILTFYPPNVGNTTIFVAEFSSSGVFQWLRWIDGTSSEEGNELTADSAGNKYVTGNSASLTVAIYTGPITTPPSPPVLPVAITSYTNPVGTGVNDSAFLLKLTSGISPISQWFRFFSGVTIGPTVNGKSVSTYGANDVYITGNSDSTTLTIVDGASGGSTISTYTSPVASPGGTENAAFIVRLDATGNIQWLRWINSVNIPLPPIYIQDEPIEITTDSSGNTYLIGKTNYSVTLDIYENTPLPISTPTTALQTYPNPGIASGANQEFFALKFNSSGDPQWILWIVGNGGDNGTGINVRTNGDIHITGTSNKPDIYLRGYDDFNSLFLSEDYIATDGTTWGFILKLRQPLAPLPPSNPVCYAKGTLIATDRGFLPIEDIKLSDKVRTFGCIEETMFRPVHGIPVKTLTRVEDTRIKNRFAKIKFVGHFTVDAMHGNSAPICITAGALGENRPNSDLFVSPNHSMLVGDRMIFAKDMVNDISIYQDMSFETIEYYHILSDDHYIINANGTLSETLGTEELALFETMIYAQSKVYEPLALENKYHLQDIAT